MNKFIIGISYIVVICLFYYLVKFRIKKEAHISNMIYVLIVFIFVLFFVWSVFRNI